MKKPEPRGQKLVQTLALPLDSTLIFLKEMGEISCMDARLFIDWSH
jgi:hypothetical protein